MREADCGPISAAEWGVRAALAGVLAAVGVGSAVWVGAQVVSGALNEVPCLAEAASGGAVRASHFDALGGGSHP